MTALACGGALGMRPLRGMTFTEPSVALAGVLFHLLLSKIACKETQKAYLPNLLVTQNSEEDTRPDSKTEGEKTTWNSTHRGQAGLKT